MADGQKREPRGVTGFLGGVRELVEKLERLTEGNGEFSRTGAFSATRGEEGSTPARGAYGFSVKLGGLGGRDDGKDFKIAPAARPRRERVPVRPAEQEVREPLVDVFDEEEDLLIVAELPGLEAEDVHVELSDRALTLSAERPGRKYRKVIEVPEGLRADRISVTCRNGIVELRAAKPGT